MNGNQFWLLVLAISVIATIMYRMYIIRLKSVEEYQQQHNFKRTIFRISKDHNIVVHIIKENPIDCKIFHPSTWDRHHCARLEFDRRKKIFTCNLSNSSIACFNPKDVEKIACIADDLNQAMLSKN